MLLEMSLVVEIFVAVVGGIALDWNVYVTKNENLEPLMPFYEMWWQFKSIGTNRSQKQNVFCFYEKL